MEHFRDIAVLVLGLGESGLAMARWAARCGASVRVWDSREAPPNEAALAEHVPGAVLLRGELRDEAFEGVRLVLKSPGLAPHDARIAGPLERALERGVLVQGELELFARALADLRARSGYAPQVVAITGTNGKTTTTSMAAQLIERAGRRVAMAGNIGPTMLQTLADALDLERLADAGGPHPSPLPEGEGATPAGGPAAAEEAAPAEEAPEEGASLAEGAAVAEDGAEQGTASEEAAATELAGEDRLPSPSGRGTEGEGPRTADDADAAPILTPPPPPPPTFEHLPEVWVLELSSFQLDDAKGFEPSAAAILNISEDHLDWHGGMSGYLAAKARVFGSRGVMVVNRDDPQVERLAAQAQPQPPATKPGSKARAPKPTLRPVLHFGLDAPRRPSDYGLVVENGMAWLVRAQPADETVRRGRGKPGDEPDEIHLQRLMPADALRVRGRHNAANALAALALADAIGCPLAPMLHALREYRGEPHRVEHLLEIGGIDAYDDSKGTNVGATVAALNGLGADRAPARLVVILGGDGKGQDFGPLAEPVRRHVRAVATIGRDAPAVEQALAATGVPLQRHDTLEAATRWCFEQARPGDGVLLSPACASLDMFRHYGHRAEVFAAAVRELAAERGEVTA